ncbi:MAG: hypothetical protein R3B36_36705 [Polyangiaceae bacterium]
MRVRIHRPHVRASLLLLAAVVAAGVVVARRSRVTPQIERDVHAAPAKVPAPDSPLARALGADDAGRGEYNLYEDGPSCGLAPRVDKTKRLGAGTVVHAANIMAPAGTTPLGFFEVLRAPADGPRPTVAATGAASSLRLVLKGPSRVAAGVGPKLSLELFNDGATPETVALAVDGSFPHWRAPFVDLYARDESSGTIYRWAQGPDYARCGNVNQRSAKHDFFVLAPRAHRTEPFGSWAESAVSPVIDTPGRYTLWVVYAACTGPEVGVSLGIDEPAPAGTFDGTLASNGVVIDVTAP